MHIDISRFITAGVRWYRINITRVGDSHQKSRSLWLCHKSGAARTFSGGLIGAQLSACVSQCVQCACSYMHATCYIYENAWGPS
jgi:hypothetical protein